MDEGGLTGNITEGTHFHAGDFRASYFKDDRKKQIKERVDKIWQEVKEETNSMVEAALRFTISFEAVTSVIPGMRTKEHLLSNIETINKGPLSNDLIERLKAHKWNRNFYK